MAAVSPFSSSFASAGSPFGDFASSSPPSRRVEGFADTQSSSGEVLELPRACSLAERQGSIGALSQQLQATQRHQEPGPPSRLTIQTTRSLRVGVSRVRRVPRIQEDAEFGGGNAGGGNAQGANGSEASLLGTTLPSGGLHPPAPAMVRVCSGNIDMPARLSKAQTAPEGLPDSLVLAALTAGYGCTQSGSRSPTAPASAACALPSQKLLLKKQKQLSLQQQQSQQQAPGRSGSGGTCSSSRPPMPVTPAFAVAARSGQHSCQQRPQEMLQRQGSTSYRDLFDAQAQTSMAQAQVTGLHEALRRKDEELEELKRELLRVSTERNMLRDVAGPGVRAIVAAASVPPVGAFGAGAGAPPAPVSQAAPQVVAAAPGLHLQARGAAVLGRRRSAGLMAAGLHSQLLQEQAAHVSAPAAPEAEATPAAPPSMVSAFANAQPFSFDERHL